MCTGVKVDWKTGSKTCLLEGSKSHYCKEVEKAADQGRAFHLQANAEAMRIWLALPTGSEEVAKECYLVCKKS